MPVSAKREALKTIERLPAGVSLEEIAYELYFRQRIDRGLRELASGKTVPHRTIQRDLARWRRSAGR